MVSPIETMSLAPIPKREKHAAHEQLQARAEKRSTASPTMAAHASQINNAATAA